jgi:hypothetical protein
MLAFASLFAWERESDDSLVIASGISPHWLTNPRGLTVQGLHTWYGTLDLSMKLDEELMIELSGDIRPPAGGFVLRPPCPGRIRSVTSNGRKVTGFSPDEITLHDFPAKVVIAFSKSRTPSRRRALDGA